MTNLNKKIIWALLLGLITIVLITFFADFKETVLAIKSFKVIYLPLILGFTCANYLLRFIKWQLFIRQLNIVISLKDSFLIFLSGLAMSITPGKAGELLKSFLLKELKGIPVSRTAPIIFAERVSDGFGLIVLAMSGMVMFSYGRDLLLILAVPLIIVLLVIKTPRLYNPCLGFCSSIPVVKRFTGTIETLIDHAGQLMTVKTLVLTITISVISWFFECIAFYFVFVGLGYKVSIIAATFTLSFSSIVGAASMLPGGLGAAEGSIIGLLVNVVGVPKNIAAVATIIIRFSTLWFGVFIGIGALAAKRSFMGLARNMDIARE